MAAVCDSTPLIALSRIGRLELLKEYFSEVYIPQEVYDEVVTHGGDLFGAKEVVSQDWIKVEEVTNRIAVESLSMILGKGESEAIVLAKERNMLLVIDDGEGRKIAESLGRGIGFRLGEKEYKRIVGD